MTEFWNKHSMAQSVEEMMLDSKAEHLTQHEHPEVMGMLPCIQGKNVLELGAGIGCKCEHCNDETLANALEFRCCHEVTNAIGKLVFDGSVENISCITEHEDYAALTNRTVLLQVAPLLSDKQGRGYRRRAGVSENERFTGDIAKEAHHVTAVDFMQSFIDKNREVNGEMFDNIDFRCADVTKLDFPKGSYDVIFSNWLLMYLSNEELQKLAQNMLRWLRDGGHLFFRESCYHSSGDMKNSDNPTVYRTPQMYTDLFSAVQEQESVDVISGFEVVTKRAVEAYAKHKKNKHQFSWLWKKVSLKSGTKGSMQEFLDNNQYNKCGILMYERMFGQGFISPGGMASTKEFVGRLNLQKDQEVLDIGCGIGGSAFYMAATFKAHVLGMDLSMNMINFALQAYECSKSSLVQFEVSDCTKRDFPSERFDAIYSRETFLHIKDKKTLFKKILSWLKPGGQLLVTDYCCCPGEHSEQFKKYLEQRQYHLVDVESYGKLLRDVGFEAVSAEDRTTQFGQIIESELKNFEKSKDEFVKDFSEEDYASMLSSWSNKLSRCRGGEQTWGVFYARKPLNS